VKSVAALLAPLRSDLATKWGVDENAVAAAAKRVDTEWGDQLRLYRTNRDVLTGLTLLYAKQPSLLFGRGIAVRVGLLEEVLSGEGDEGKNALRKERLLRLVTLTHDKGAATLPGNVQAAIDAFYAAVPAWSSPATSTVFFRDIAPGSDVYRVQLSGNCFMNAPDVVAHYVVCKNNRSQEALKEMVDLTAHVLKNFDGGRLWKYVYKDGGGYSKGFLLEITGLDEADTRESVATDLSGDMVVDRLEKFGPALLMRFKVFDGFGGGDQAHTHIGREDRPATGQHAMAVVGWRKREDGKIGFLVQNWWKSKQFFECDLEFLRSRHASLVWITSNLTKLPESLPRTFQSYEENELTGNDRVPEEA
jgi:hypothetical protein